MPLALTKNLGRAVDAVLAPLRSLRSSPSTSFDEVSRHIWEASYPRGIDWNAAIDTKPLTCLLDDAVAAHGEKPCIKFRGRSFRYKEVGDLVERIEKDMAVRPAVTILGALVLGVLLGAAFKR